MTDSPWKIPESWAWTTTGEIARIVGGGTPRTDDSTNFENGDIPGSHPLTCRDTKKSSSHVETGILQNTGLRILAPASSHKAPYCSARAPQLVMSQLLPTLSAPTKVSRASFCLRQYFRTTLITTSSV